MSGGGSVAELPVVCRICDTKPDYRGGAGILAAAVLKWFEDPEHEKEYQEWKKAKEKA